MALTRESVIEALKTIQGPKGQDIVTGGEVRALDVGEKDVRFVLEIDQALARSEEHTSELQSHS